MSIIDHAAVSALNGLIQSQAQIDISMANISNWKVGGNARVLVRPKNKEEVIAIRKFITEHQLPLLVIGNTTNLLFTDENIEAVLLQIDGEFSEVQQDGNVLVAQAGIWVPKLARFALQTGLSGIEHTCGIPGTIGGLIVMNGGSQRKGISDNVLYVKTIDSLGNLKFYNKDDCQFAYRSSIFQQLDEIIVEVGLQLEPVINKKAMHLEMLSILHSRSKKFPRKMPNCGSVFVSNPAMYERYGPPGKVIEECGLKGLKKGEASVSPNHANFIVNNGEAAAEDILHLINAVRDKVYQNTGYLMKVEPKFVTAAGEIREI